MTLKGSHKIAGGKRARERERRPRNAEGNIPTLKGSHSQG